MIPVMPAGVRSFLPIVLVLPIFATALFARDKVAYIEFFGYKDVDVEAVRNALPFHAGDKLSTDFKDQARTTVKRITGRDLTDFGMTCCVEDGDTVVFIGLPGSSSRTFRLNPSPQGDAALSSELIALNQKRNEAEMKAVQSGHAEEDGSPGYRLMKEPIAHAAELATRTYVIEHQDEVTRMLESSGNRDRRAMAADALGYGARNSRQLAVLVTASRDPDSEVRNNATRALSEILRADPSIASQIPPDAFIDMVRSGTWTDRNKSGSIRLRLALSMPSLQPSGINLLPARMRYWSRPPWTTRIFIRSLARMDSRASSPPSTAMYPGMMCSAPCTRATTLKEPKSACAIS